MPSEADIDRTKYLGARACRATCYHLDPECDRAVQGTREPRPATDAELAYHDLEPCPECAGGLLCPGCGDEGSGDAVLAPGQRYCPNGGCRVVSYQTDGGSE